MFTLRLPNLVATLLFALTISLPQIVKSQCTGTGTLLYPMPDLFPVSKVVHLGSDTIMLLGGVGNTPMASTTFDGGQTWQSSSLPFWGSILSGVLWQGGRVVAVGSQGLVATSTNYGHTWQQGSSFSFVNLTSAAALDSVVYVCGELGLVYKSTNYGQTFVNVSPAQTEHLYAIAMHPSGSVVAVGENGRTVRTNNGGSSWQTDALSPLYDLKAVAFKTADTLYAVGDQRLIGASVDSGVDFSLQRVDTIAAQARDVVFYNNKNYLVNQNGMFIEFTHQGAAIDSTSFKVTEAELNTISRHPNGLFAAGAHGHLYDISPADTTAQRLTDAPTGAVGTLMAPATDTLLATLPNQLIASHDSGHTWTTQPNWPARFYSLGHQHQQTILLATQSGLTAHSTNGGTTWNHRTANNTLNLQNINYLPAQGWLMVDSAALYVSSDTGQTLTTLPLSSPHKLNDCYFASANVGYAVADSGLIFKTTNGGSNWTTLALDNALQQDSNTSWKAVYFLDELNGFVAGDRYAGHALLRTTNGGDTWINQSENYLPAIYDLHFYDDLNGYASGLAGFMAYTTNGGQQWDNAPAITNGQLTAVAFVGQNSLLIGDNQGNIFTTPRCDNLLSTPEATTQAATTALYLYPNPAQHQVQITPPTQGPATLRLTSLTGSTVATMPILLQNQPFTFNLNPHWAKGVYIVTLHTQQQVFTSKLIIE